MGEGDVDTREGCLARFGGVAIAFFAIVILVAIFVFPPLLSPYGERVHHARSANNLKQLGIVFKMYAGESTEEKYPPITPYPGVWMFDVRAVYPEYLTDLSVLVNPELPDAEALRKQMDDLQYQKPTDWEAITRLAAHSYMYVPWAIRETWELKQLSEARRSADPEYLDDDMEYNGKTFYRLCEGVERHFVTDAENPDALSIAQSQILTMFEATRRGNGNPGRCVLYIDGHVESCEDYADLESLLE